MAGSSGSFVTRAGHVWLECCSDWVVPKAVPGLFCVATFLSVFPVSSCQPQINSIPMSPASSPLSVLPLQLQVS